MIRCPRVVRSGAFATEPAPFGGVSDDFRSSVVVALVVGTGPVAALLVGLLVGGAAGGGGEVGAPRFYARPFHCVLPVGGDAGSTNTGRASSRCFVPVRMSSVPWT